MDYIRWLIKRVFSKNPELIFPILMLSVFIIILGYAIHVIIGVTVTIIAVLIWGIIIYAYLSEIFRSSYVKYQQEKNRGS
jgi:4-amino-4-deoxy-L-arabinose transferase-like glycosyltransferase